MAEGSDKPRVRVQAPSYTADGYMNLPARLGQGTDNLAAAGGYTLNPTSRNRAQLDAMYRGSWIVGQAVDAIPDDMTRAGIDIQSSLEPDQIERLHVAARELCIWESLNDTAKWSRLYGGAVGVLLVDGHDTATPLRTQTVGKGQFRGVMPLDRWLLEPSLSQAVAELGPDLGMPESYRVLSNVPGLSGKVVHHSRCVRMDGVQLPFYQRQAENGWGQSVVERLQDRLLAFDSTTQGMAQLVFRANLRTYKMKGLWATIGGGGVAFQALMKRMEWMRLMQSNEGITLVDGEDDFQTHTYAFSGLSDVLAQMSTQLSGALGIPLTRLFGQSPAGFSSGDADIRSYYDSVHQQQERRFRRPVGKILDLLCRSELGIEPPEGFGFSFTPLWQMSSKERAEIAAAVTGAVTQAEETGIIDRAIALRELRASSEITGVFGSISDEAIEEAENDPPPVDESEGGDVALLPAPGVDPRTGTEDAASRTLYVKRSVTNAAEIIAWAKAQGFATTLAAADLHVTLAYSRTPFDWFAVGTDSEKVVIPRGGPRMVEPLGDKGAVVLLFASWELNWRWERFREAGASWDHDGYQPHVTITYDPGDVDLAKVQPYPGPILLGPEVFAPLDLEWTDKVKETSA